ncbi:endonuclease III [Deltaproteobacteria bacterium]|nr:endonuclease III [Deltaproteobacteria bacterium]
MGPWLDALRRMVPDPKCELDFRNPFELLIATQLSAQSTDVMVNKVTPELFRRWPDAASLAAADPAEVEAVLRPTGFFRQKAKNAIATAKLLVAQHGGEVPPVLEEIVKFPGAARKTANVVLGTAFGISSGVTVDTHVFRVTTRWGWHREKTPEKVEAVLMRALPRDEWPAFGHRVVLFGRYHCTARAPKCGACQLRALCPWTPEAPTPT